MSTVICIVCGGAIVLGALLLFLIHHVDGGMFDGWAKRRRLNSAERARERLIADRIQRGAIRSIERRL